jgi:ABC-type glycerol-3-phosphate transport system substrate-binding protein
VRWLSIFAAVVALSVVAVGCGGSDEAASGDTTVTETTTDETTTEETTTDETTTDGTPDLSGVFADEDCLALVAAAASFSQAFTGTSATSDETNAFEELAAKVPDEIRADVQVLAEAYAKYAAEINDIGIEAGQTPSAEQLQQLQAALASFDQQGVSEASQRLSTWAQTNCPSG